MNYEIKQADAFDLLRSMPDDSVDCVITDPPYSERTHKGHRAGIGIGFDGSNRADLHYGFLSEPNAVSIAAELCRVSRGWVVIMTDHILVVPIQSSMESAGRYAFAPLTYYAPGSRTRLGGDGPASWSIWIVVSRPRHEPYSKWGTLPGGYLAGKGWRERNYIGGKPLQLMQCLVRDYSREGDLVFDPFMGSGTTGAAAINMGRRFLGCDSDPDAVALSEKRISAAVKQSLQALPFTKQEKLL